MPPAKKRTRSYDFAKIRAAVLAQFGNVRRAVQGLDEAQLALPTRLGDWTVRELAVHLTTGVDTVRRGLEREEPARAELTLLDWPSVTARGSELIAGGARDLAAARPDLDALFAQTQEGLVKALDQASGDRLIAVRTGAMTLTDFLVTRAVELVVHTDDLDAAVPGLDVPQERQALAACTRLLADVLAARVPGGATEVRIPPFAVVQCVEGPRHTRGTPPNVVETDPLTWIRLATGRTAWADALAEARVRAGGERADLSPYLPLMG
ncbi:maleylpyruvate isomerase family mycothiol-dependent enzyme [Streptomyces sp. SBST2-5]|uniref:Maleylpyruvate isomerase family mycothiol-dependent enzyme n=1 Tax=Streptomyces composti TaxID=2720025 RepID=A0ABX1AED0_9ACTN|nr:maleylpyruvate isomerase family mycothiol-dependent enzyme [Streptomyces composti]NJP51961.1 maleylpyruvate isomerase family mycothiol-dependent enzyme [Streptomyces composti]